MKPIRYLLALTIFLLGFLSIPFPVQARLKASAPCDTPAVIAADQTFSPAECDPYTAQQNIIVQSGAKLTLETGVTLIVKGDILVEEGATLEAAPGAVLRFAPGTGLYLDNGVLLARGSAEQPVTFTSNETSPAPGDWVGIQFKLDASSGGGSSIEYATIEFAGGEDPSGSEEGAIWLYGIFAEKRSSLQVANSILRYNRGYGLSINDAPQCTIANNEIYNNQKGGIEASGSLDISGNQIHDNTGTAIEVSSAATIQNNVIFHNKSGNNSSGIYALGSGKLNLTGNLIYANLGAGAAVYSQMESVVVQNTIAANVGGGLQIYASDLKEFHDNNLVGNSADGGPMDLRVWGDQDASVNAANNYWGVTDDSEIEERIFHKVDDLGTAMVNYTPFLTAPASGTPSLPAVATPTPVPADLPELVRKNSDSYQLVDFSLQKLFGTWLIEGGEMIRFHPDGTAEYFVFLGRIRRDIYTIEGNHITLNCMSGSACTWASGGLPTLQATVHLDAYIMQGNVDPTDYLLVLVDTDHGFSQAYMLLSGEASAPTATPGPTPTPKPTLVTRPTLPASESLLLMETTPKEWLPDAVASIRKSQSKDNLPAEDRETTNQYVAQQSANTDQKSAELKRLGRKTGYLLRYHDCDAELNYEVLTVQAVLYQAALGAGQALEIFADQFNPLVKSEALVDWGHGGYALWSEYPSISADRSAVSIAGCDGSQVEAFRSLTYAFQYSNVLMLVRVDRPLQTADEAAMKTRVGEYAAALQAYAEKDVMAPIRMATLKAAGSPTPIRTATSPADVSVTRTATAVSKATSASPVAGRGLPQINWAPLGIIAAAVLIMGILIFIFVANSRGSKLKEAVAAVFSQGRWQMQLMKLNGDLGQLEKQKSRSIAELGAKAWQGRCAHPAYAETYAALEELERQQVGARSEIGALDLETNRETQAQNEARARFGEQISAAQARKQAFANQLAQIKALQKAAEQRLSQAQGQYQKTNHEIQTLQARITQLQSSSAPDKNVQIATLSGGIPVLQQTLTNLAAQFPPIQAEIAQQQAAQQPVLAQITANEQEIAGLQKALKDALAPIERRISNLNEMKRTASERLAQLGRQMDERVAQLGPQVNQARPEQPDLQPIYASVDRLEQEKEKAKAQVSLMNARLATLDSGDIRRFYLLVGLILLTTIACGGMVFGFSLLARDGIVPVDETAAPTASLAVEQEGPVSQETARPSERFLEGHVDDILEVAFSSDGSLLASASQDGDVRLWRVADGSIPCKLEGHQPGGFAPLVFSPDSRWLVSRGKDAMRIWNVADCTLVKELKDTQATFSPNGQLLISPQNIWQVSDWSTVNNPGKAPQLDTYETILAFSPDGSLMASSDRSHVNLWKVDDWSFLGEVYPRSEQNNITQMAFAPDGRSLALATSEGIVRLDTVDWKKLPPLRPSEMISKIVFSPDGQYLLGKASSLRIWRLIDGELVNELADLYLARPAFALSPDGKILAVGLTSAIGDRQNVILLMPFEPDSR